MDTKERMGSTTVIYRIPVQEDTPIQPDPEPNVYYPRSPYRIWRPTLVAENMASRQVTWYATLSRLPCDIAF